MKEEASRRPICPWLAAVVWFLLAWSKKKCPTSIIHKIGSDGEFGWSQKKHHFGYRSWFPSGSCRLHSVLLALELEKFTEYLQEVRTSRKTGAGADMTDRTGRPHSHTQTDRHNNKKHRTNKTGTDGLHTEIIDGRPRTETSVFLQSSCVPITSVFRRAPQGRVFQALQRWTKVPRTFFVTFQSTCSL